MLFLTTYDPLGKTAGSVDPLGALQSYGELADLLLPNISTITRRSRYLSMLCAALENAERYRSFPVGPAGLPLRRKAIEPYERLWALACVAARQGGNSAAADGLRGITYAQAAFDAWSADCHLAAAANAERQLLAEALTTNARRAALARALQAYGREQPLPTTWDVPTLRRLHHILTRDDRASALGLPSVVDAIIAAEQFHEAALAVFESALWWGTERESRPTSDLLADVRFHAATEVARNRADPLLVFSARCDRAEVKKALASLLPFAGDLVRVRAPGDVLEEVLRRHHRMQSGKLDGGVAKRDWITLGAGGKLLRPAPRFQRTERPEEAQGEQLTHPYRLEQFVGMLRENDALDGTPDNG
jgi:hypothetical protein